MLWEILGSTIAMVLVGFAWFVKTSDCSLNLFWAKRSFNVNKSDYFKGKNVWVIGASSGIGRSTAMELNKDGAHVYISARRLNELNSLKVEMTHQNSEARVVIMKMDITNNSEVDDSIKAFTKSQNKVDIIVLATGRSQRSEWIDVDEQVDLDCFKINALAPTILTRKFLKAYQSQGKLNNPIQFIVISSVCGVMPAIMSPSYTAAKHALMGYFRTLALEWLEKDVRVSIVCPSLTFCPNNVMNAFTGKDGTSNGEVLEQITNQHMTANRCAEAILESAAYGLAETWLSKNFTILLMAYLTVYYPSLYLRVSRIIGVENIKKMRSGNYD
uniref:Dehydrogenase/reductase SDR family member 7 n=1 Tax=Rhabditophanes sp. KR3021 TaxID=114890 RepID=A0AC35UEX9_9BILA